MILVTGGAGFIGSHLVGQLVEAGEAVRVLDRSAPREGQLPVHNVDVRIGDIRDAQTVEAAVQGCECVYHLAANPQLWTHRKGHFKQVNFDGAKNVIEAALHAGAKRVLHCSTESILTRRRQTGPISEDQHVPLRDVIGPYCRSKWLADCYALRRGKAGAPVVVVNPTLPIGPGDWRRSPPTQMLLDCARGRRSCYLDAELNLIDVRDVAAGMRNAMTKGQPGRRYLLGAANWTIRGLFEHVSRREGVAPPRLAVPYSVALCTAMVSEWWSDVFTQRIPAATTTGVRLTRRTMKFDASRSLAELDIRPRVMADSVNEALDWFRSVGWT